MDVQITPEPSPEEREAIIRALELEQDPEPSAWQRATREELCDGAAAPEPRRDSGVVEA